MSFPRPSRAQAPIRVGIIGASPGRGWGSAVHVPVLQHLGEFSLVAVATTREETARRSAGLFGVRNHFTDPQALVGHPDVDLVTIAVKAPDHYRLAKMALQAGKHVYCEWPLAATAEQAAEMQALAVQHGVQTVVGLQARGAPALRRFRDLVRDGYVGQPVAARLRCALPGGGRRRSREGVYVIDQASGASTLRIQGGHAIDALRFCVGEIAQVTGVVANHYQEIEVIETGERMPKTALDQVVAAGLLDSGAVVSVAVSGGVVSGHGIELELLGEEGSLRAGWTGTWNFQMSPLTLWGARAPHRALEELSIPAGYDPMAIPVGVTGRQPYPGVDVPRATLANVANLYRDLGDAIVGGRPAAPDFGVGLSLHRLLDGIEGVSPADRG